MTRMLYHIRRAPHWHALIPRFAELIYNGARFSPRVVGWRSPKSLYSFGHVTSEGT
jgi:hypothetical protein